MHLQNDAYQAHFTLSMLHTRHLINKFFRSVFDIWQNDQMKSLSPSFTGVPVVWLCTTDQEHTVWVCQTPAQQELNTLTIISNTQHLVLLFSTLFTLIQKISKLKPQ